MISFCLFCSVAVHFEKNDSPITTHTHTLLSRLVHTAAPSFSPRQVWLIPASPIPSATCGVWPYLRFRSVHGSLSSSPSHLPHTLSFTPCCKTKQPLDVAFCSARVHLDSPHPPRGRAGLCSKHYMATSQFMVMLFASCRTPCNAKPTPRHSCSSPSSSTFQPLSWAPHTLVHLVIVSLPPPTTAGRFTACTHMHT